jgi:hypothetical protein
METWTMEMAKRARKAETPKQTSHPLRLRAPYLYPDHGDWTTASANTHMGARDDRCCLGHALCGDCTMAGGIDLGLR